MTTQIQESPEAFAKVKALFRFKAARGVDPALVNQLKTAFDRAWSHVPAIGREFIARMVTKPHTLLLLRLEADGYYWEYRSFKLGNHYSTCSDAEFAGSSAKDQMEGILLFLALIATCGIFRNSDMLCFDDFSEIGFSKSDVQIMEKSLVRMWLTGKPPVGNRIRMEKLQEAIGELQETIRLYTPEAVEKAG